MCGLCLYLHSYTCSCPLVSEGDRLQDYLLTPKSMALRSLTGTGVVFANNMGPSSLHFKSLLAYS